MNNSYATSLEMDILSFLINQCRGTWVFSYSMPDFGYDIFQLDHAFNFLRESKYIDIEIVDEKLFCESIFKTKVTEAGNDFYQTQLETRREWMDHNMREVQDIIESLSVK